MSEPETWTKPRQFRLTQSTLDELDFLQDRLGLTGRSDVIRSLVRQAAIASGWLDQDNHKQTSRKR